MIQKLLIAFLFLGWCACSSPEKRPDGVLTQPQLSAMLIDIYIAEARLQPLPIAKDSSVHFFIPYEQKMLQTRGISDSILKLTYSYYLAHPKELEQVYDAVIDTLTVRDQRTAHGYVPGKKKPQLKPQLKKLDKSL